MSSINSLLESAASGWKNMQSDAARMSAKWAKTGLLEGLNSEIEKNNMALILENQAKQLVVEQSSTNVGGANFVVGQGEQWAGVALPLVRKVFGSLSSKEFVSVQPMNLPSGLVFFLDFQYGSGGSMYGNRTNANYPFATPDTAGGLYGAGRFTYSTNQTSSTVTLALASSTPTVLQSGKITSASWANLGFDSSLSASVAAKEIKACTVTTSSIPNFDVDGVRGFVISGSTITAASNLPAFTQLDLVNGNITFFITASATLADPSTPIVFYNKRTADNARGDFEDGSTYAIPNAQSTTEISIPEINISMQSQAITAKTKKLKAVWTPEFAQDLNAYQNLDVEAELTNIMSEYISMEIDLEILDMLIEDAAAATKYWSAVSNQTISTSGVIGTSNYYNTQGQWFQTLGTKIQKVSNKIHQLTLRGGANFLVTSPTIATILESIPGFASTNNGEADQMEYAFGVQKIGAVNGRYKVYKNPYMTENLILMGYRGSQFLETGAVFAPYIPLIMTPFVYDPDTFTPRKGLLTRYAKKMLRPEFYGKVYVHALNRV